MLLILEAMKMEHELHAPVDGRVQAVFFAAGDTVDKGDLLLNIEQTITNGRGIKAKNIHNLSPDPVSSPAGGPRADLQRVIDRHALTLDANRPEAVAKRHALGLRTARENIADLCDAGSFKEYGALAVAAQRSRRSEDDLVRNTPADGMVTGIGSINAALFGAEAAQAVVMAYDATVLAGTQGLRNHQKTDRMLGIALQNKLPVVLLAEGGGGPAGRHRHAHRGRTARGHVCQFCAAQWPGAGGGHCGGALLCGQRGTAGLLRRDHRHPGQQHRHGRPGHGGGRRAGRLHARTDRPERGPACQWRDRRAGGRRSGGRGGGAPLPVVFSRAGGGHSPHRMRLALRDVVPENRLRVYDTRAALTGLVDAGSLLELRTGFGVGIHTALGRIEGRPVGLLANNPLHLGGAIDADAADKAARFMQLCNAHGLPLVSLVDTPGFMVGPDIEAQAQVRHVSRMFIAAAHLRVPFFSVVLRKGYGLGAMAMTAGGFHAPVFNVAWPTGEFGAMGLEGAVRLGYRKELAAAPEGPAREALYQAQVARQYEAGQALNMAATLEIDAVIDPAETRGWLAQGLQAARGAEPGPAMAARMVDSW